MAHSNTLFNHAEERPVVEKPQAKRRKTAKKTGNVSKEKSDGNVGTSSLLVDSVTDTTPDTFFDNTKSSNFFTPPAGGKTKWPNDGFGTRMTNNTMMTSTWSVDNDNFENNNNNNENNNLFGSQRSNDSEYSIFSPQKQSKYSSKLFGKGRYVTPHSLNVNDNEMSDSDIDSNDMDITKNRQNEINVFEKGSNDGNNDSVKSTLVKTYFRQLKENYYESLINDSNNNNNNDTNNNGNNGFLSNLHWRDANDDKESKSKKYQSGFNSNTFNDFDFDKIGGNFTGTLQDDMKLLTLYRKEIDKHNKENEILCKDDTIEQRMDKIRRVREKANGHGIAGLNRLLPLPCNLCLKNNDIKEWIVCEFGNMKMEGLFEDNDNCEYDVATDCQTQEEMDFVFDADASNNAKAFNVNIIHKEMCNKLNVSQSEMDISAAHILASTFEDLCVYILDHGGMLAKQSGCVINSELTNENEIKNEIEDIDINPNKMNENVSSRHIITSHHLQQVFNNDLHLHCLANKLNYHKNGTNNDGNNNRNSKETILLIKNVLNNSKCLRCIVSYFKGDLPMLGVLTRINLTFYAILNKEDNLWEPIARRLFIWDVTQYPSDDMIDEIGLCGYMERFATNKMTIEREAWVQANVSCFEQFSRIMRCHSGFTSDWNCQLFIRLNPIYDFDLFFSSLVTRKMTNEKDKKVNQLPLEMFDVLKQLLAVFGSNDGGIMWIADILTNFEIIETKKDLLEELYYCMEDITSCNACDVYNCSKYRKYYHQYHMIPQKIGTNLLNQLKQSMEKMIDMEMTMSKDKTNVKFIKLAMSRSCYKSGTASNASKLDDKMVPKQLSNTICQPNCFDTNIRQRNMRDKWAKLAANHHINSNGSGDDMDIHLLYIGRNFVFYRSVDVNVVDRYQQILNA